MDIFQSRILEIVKTQGKRYTKNRNGVSRIKPRIIPSAVRLSLFSYMISICLNWFVADIFQSRILEIVKTQGKWYAKNRNWVSPINPRIIPSAVRLSLFSYMISTCLNWFVADIFQSRILEIVKTQGKRYAKNRNWLSRINPSIIPSAVRLSLFSYMISTCLNWFVPGIFQVKMPEIMKTASAILMIPVLVITWTVMNLYVVLKYPPL